MRHWLPGYDTVVELTQGTVQERSLQAKVSEGYASYSVAALHSSLQFCVESVTKFCSSAHHHVPPAPDTFTLYVHNAVGGCV
jgi:hypothetical protein